jgi:hypothetical protein
MVSLYVNILICTDCSDYVLMKALKKDDAVKFCKIIIRHLFTDEEILHGVVSGRSIEGKTQLNPKIVARIKGKKE